MIKGSTSISAGDLIGVSSGSDAVSQRVASLPPIRVPDMKKMRELRSTMMRRIGSLSIAERESSCKGGDSMELIILGFNCKVDARECTCSNALLVATHALLSFERKSLSHKGSLFI